MTRSAIDGPVVAQAEKASLQSSLASFTVAQKSLMNSSFAKATEDRLALKDGVL